MKKLLFALLILSLSLLPLPVLAHEGNNLKSIPPSQAANTANNANNVPRELTLEFYSESCPQYFEKFGQQLRKSAVMENSHGGGTFTLIALQNYEILENGIQSGTHVNLTAKGGTLPLKVSHIHPLDGGRTLICLDCSDISRLARLGQCDIRLEFYSNDTSDITFSGNLRNVPLGESPHIPQTGDNATLFALAAVVSLIFMAFLLSPKSSKSLLKYRD